MKKFTFSLKKVLEYKTHMEEYEKEVLAQLNSCHHQLENELMGLGSRYIALQGKYTEKCRRGSEVVEIAGIRSYLQELLNLMRKKRQEIQLLEKKIDKQIDKIIELAQEKNAMEKLEERYYQFYKDKLRKETENFIDDFVVNTKQNG